MCFIKAVRFSAGGFFMCLLLFAGKRQRSFNLKEKSGRSLFCDKQAAGGADNCESVKSLCQMLAASRTLALRVIYYIMRIYV